MLNRNGGLFILAVLTALSACSKKEEILPGERIAVRDTLAGVTERDTGAANRAEPVAIPAQTGNAEWTQRGGSASHHIANPAIRAAVAPVWSAAIGAAEGRKSRITADPVVAGGRIFTIDAASTVTATGGDGGTLWQAGLTPANEKAGDRSGGGLAYSGGRLFATTGFGELVALNPATGQVLWRQKLDAPVSGAPTAVGDRVYVVGRNAVGWAIDAATGKVDWTLPGTSATSGVIGTGAPAVGDGTVVFPFASGDLIAVTTGGGAERWTANLSGQRLGRAWSSIRDITSDPVIVGNRLYAGNQSGRVAAIDLTSGERIWSAREGAYGPVAVTGSDIFLINDEAQLVRLSSSTGEKVWAVPLPHYTATKEKKRAEIHVHYGPVLAGGRLFVASSDGELRIFDPASGALVGNAPIPGGAATAPVVAGGAAYVVSRDGKLHAFR